jgi:hydroxypyruvate reductase
MISDVPGDDPAVIGSGPTVGDPTTFADARAILKKYKIQMSKSVTEYFVKAEDETIKPGDPRLESIETHIIANPQLALDAAAKFVAGYGFNPLILGHQIEGEAREVAKVLKGITLQIAEYGQPVIAPAAIISGGETTVTVIGSGRGGRNLEFLLSSAIEIDGHPRVYCLAADTDGIDGTEDNAGAILMPQTLAQAALRGINPKSFLANNDGYGFFQALGSLVVTGPTRTNVNDLRIHLIMPDKMVLRS